jgi:hypothetical protein
MPFSRVNIREIVEQRFLESGGRPLLLRATFAVCGADLMRAELQPQRRALAVSKHSGETGPEMNCG